MIDELLDLDDVEFFDLEDTQGDDYDEWPWTGPEPDLMDC